MLKQQQELEKLKPIDMDAGQVFSGKASGTIVRGFAKPCAYTPEANPDYIFHEHCRDVIVWLCSPHEPLYIYGSVGAGKSSCVKQLAVRLNYPVFEINGHGRLEFADLVGHLAVHNGSMEYEYGPLALAMRYGGIFLLNEIDLTPPEVAAGLNTILDGSPLCISENGGELIRPHPMFRFVTTANTNGGGDMTGLYQGTQRQNLAWLDRFVLVQMDYPKPDVEMRLLRERCPSLPEDVCSHMVSYANEVRKQFVGEASTDNLTDTLEVTFSTRSLLRWADLTVRYQPLARQGVQPITYALDRALAFRASRESRTALHELAQRHFPRQETRKIEKTTMPNVEKTGEQAIAYLQHNLKKTASSLPSVYLEKRNYKPDGSGSKFWEGTVQRDGFALKYGATGQSGAAKHFGISDCSGHDPKQELLKRATGKLKEGYALLLDKSHF